MTARSISFTARELRDLSAALRLRAEASEANDEADDAARWRKLLGRVDLVELELLPVEVPEDAASMLADALAGYLSDGDFLCYHACQGPNVDGTHRCGLCRMLAARAVVAASALGMEEEAAEWRATLERWKAKDGR